VNLADALNLQDTNAGPSGRQTRMLERLPASWQAVVWTKVQALEAQHPWYPQWKNREGNVYLYGLMDRLDRLPVKVDDDAEDITKRAREFASRAEQITKRHTQADACRAALEAMCRRWSIDPPASNIPTKQAIARMVDPQWSRRQFRKQHERSLEADAIALGLVHRRASIYISEEALKRHRAQQRANASMLEETTAQNEEGDEFTLAELAERGISNKKNRRAELMTRLRGCEDYGKDVGHVAEFVTITAPSAMHARLWISGDANAKHNGTTPRQAHEYLQSVWERIRAKLNRKGLRVYGIRIAEPHHDACPHWHLLLFMEPAQVATVRAIITEHALREQPDEIGAEQRRVTFVSIDPAKGSAVGYVAKYVAKNIDGHALEKDLEGVPARDATERVNAWASLHGIRQFQFVGLPPVGLWRELRRVPAETVRQAPETLRRAWQAAQRSKRQPDEGSKEQTEQRADYGEFLQATGGPQQSRKDYPLRVAKQWTDRQGRYGEEAGLQPFGVMLRDDPTKVYVSIRHTWTINGRRGATTTARPGRAPWTRVNNCTGKGQTAPIQDKPMQANEPAKVRNRASAAKPPRPCGPFDALLDRFRPTEPPGERRA
jgi:hypothetical protein